MFVQLACLPLAAVLINDVRTESSAGVMTVDVATSEPVARADVRGVSGGPRRMFVYVQGTQASRQSFGAGPEAVVVHPRARYTKLEIPTDGRCAEPMSVESTSAGIRVRAACQNSGMPAGLLAPPFRLPGKDHAKQPSPDAPQAARVRSPAQSESLRAALALPAEATDKESDLPPADDLGHGASAAETAGNRIPAGTAAPVGSENTAESVAANAGKSAAPVKPAPIAPSTQPDAPAAALTSTDAPSPSSAGSTGGEGKSSSSTVSTVLAVLLLVGLGVAATIVSRRRATRTRMIRIVETASIGPRRSLVVACIGGRTMVLGVSEAGVSLLDAQAGSITPPPTFERAQSASLAEAALRGFGHAEAQAESAPSAPSADDGKHEGSLSGAPEGESNGHFDSVEAQFFEQGQDSMRLVADGDYFADQEDPSKGKWSALSRPFFMGLAVGGMLGAVLVGVVTWRMPGQTRAATSEPVALKQSTGSSASIALANAASTPAPRPGEQAGGIGEAAAPDSSRTLRDAQPAFARDALQAREHVTRLLSAKGQLARRKVPSLFWSKASSGPLPGG